ncbi:MAG TPA: helix-turn-helix domain-containing protein, partial [candidate division Zixibacteria bacterium]|nr:helix-turn-helix domain-containing protein [candidate division Zixibacteria bacterium]
APGRRGVHGRVDVWIVAATNKDLEVLVGKDLFREDLFFRLSVITIAVPPLRERGDDVLVLARHFAEKFAGEQGRTTPRLSDGAIEVFRTYNWPGNVRELENVVRRLVVMSDRDVVDIPDLPALMRYSAPKEGGVARRLAEVEGEYIRNVLARVGGNKTKAAEILGIDRKTLREKLKRG